MHTVSGSLSLAVRRSFHLSLTVLFTIGHRFVFSLGGWSPQIQPGFHVPRPTRVPTQQRYPRFVYGTLTLYGPPFQARSTTLSRRPHVGPSTPDRFNPARFRLLPFRSPLLRESLLISLPPGTEMFQFPGLATLSRRPGSHPARLPHSDTPGSTLACSSPRLFAACHVLHRRSVPRHPPCALPRLTSISLHSDAHRQALTSQ
jgi:hypothetical protein